MDLDRNFTASIIKPKTGTKQIRSSMITIKSKMGSIVTSPGIKKTFSVFSQNKLSSRIILSRAGPFHEWTLKIKEMLQKLYKVLLITNISHRKHWMSS